MERSDMSDYVLSCCTPLDTSRDWLNERGIACIPFHYEIGGELHEDDFWSSMSPETLYGRMLKGEDSRTSQANVIEYTRHFEYYLAKGIDVLHLTLSSGISATLNSALIAREELQEKYPERKLIVLDSLAASSGYGLLMEKLYRLKEEGKSIDETAAFAAEHRLNVHHWFFTSDLTFFIRGGRVTKTAGFFGTLLNICPLLNVDFEGRLIPREKIRTKRKVILRALEKMETFAEGGTAYDDTCYISYSACLPDAEALKSLIEERFPKLSGKVRLFPIGSVIGCHTGPGTVALFFWGSKRTD